MSNGFLSQKALVNNLARHYTREGLKEAHKVLGGAGPAVASVPLTVLWAGGSAFSLVRGITAGSTGPVIALQQLAYVPLMSFSMVSFSEGEQRGMGDVSALWQLVQALAADAQCRHAAQLRSRAWPVVKFPPVRCPHTPTPARPFPPQIASGFSRMLAALLAALPPDRAAGDDDTVQRLIKRPNSALEALARAPAELFYGVSAAAKGLVLDPVAVGWARVGECMGGVALPSASCRIAVHVEGSRALMRQFSLPLP